MDFSLFFEVFPIISGGVRKDVSCFWHNPRELRGSFYSFHPGRRFVGGGGKRSSSPYRWYAAPSGSLRTEIQGSSAPLENAGARTRPSSSVPP